MATTDPIEWQLLDTDLTTMIAILPAAGPGLFQLLSEPGSGRIRIPLDSAIASSITSGQFVRAKYRGAIRGGFFVENINKKDAQSGEGGGRWLEISGRGALAYLDEAIVWQTTASTVRTFDGTMASVMIDLIDEAIVRGAIANLTYDFTDALDTDGNAWTDDDAIELQVGLSLLGVLRKFAGYGIDFDITLEDDGTFTLHAYTSKGDDLSETIYLRIGQNVLELDRKELGADIRNALNVRYPDGFLHITDSTSISSYRRRELLQREEAAGTSSAAMTFGQTKLDLSKDPQSELAVKITDQYGPQIYEDYNLGDTIVLDREGTEADYRIRGLQLGWEGSEDFADVVISLNSMILENEIRMALDLADLKSLWTTAMDLGQHWTTFWAAVSQPKTGTLIGGADVSGDKIYVGGSFSMLGGIECTNVAVFDMATGEWSNIGEGVDDTVACVKVIGDKVYFGGTFTQANGNLACNHIVEYDTTLDSWDNMNGGPTPNTTIHGFEADGTDLLAVGNITDGVGWRVRRWNGAAWADEGARLDSGMARAIVKDASGDIYIVGEFLTSGGTTLNRVAVQNGAAWDPIGSGATKGVDDTAHAFEVIDSTLYVGGEFHNAGGSAALHIAQCDLTSEDWSDVNGGCDDIVYALQGNLTDLYVGGIFNHVGDPSVNASHVALWNQANWNILGEIGLSAACYDINIHDSINIVCTGGSFTADGKDTPLIAIYMTEFLEVADYLEATNSCQPHPPDQGVQYNKDGRFHATQEFRYDYDNHALIFGAEDPPVISSSTVNLIEDGTSPAHLLWAYGTSVAGFIAGFRARGTYDSPTAVQADDVFLRVRGRGWDGTTWSGTRTEIRLMANENWSAGNHGARIELHATPDGSTTMEKVVSIATSLTSIESPLQVNDYVAIDGSTDNIQLYVEEYAPQTADIVRVSFSGGADTIFRVDPSGYFGIGVNQVPTEPRAITTGINKTDPSAAVYTIYARQFTTANLATDTYQHRAAWFDYDVYGSQDYTGVIGGGHFTTYYYGTGTLSYVRNIISLGGSITNGGDITSLSLFYAQTYGTGAGVISSLIGYHVSPLDVYNSPGNVYGMKVDSMTTGGTNKYGIQVGNISGASTVNDAISTSIGRVYHGDYMWIDGSQDAVQFTVEGNSTQTNDILRVQSSGAGTVHMRVTGEGKVGVNCTPVASAWMHIDKVYSNYAAGGNNLMYVYSRGTGDAGGTTTARSAYILAQLVGANNAATVSSTAMVSYHSGSGALTSLLGSETYLYISGSGNVTNIYGSTVYFLSTAASTGNATNLIGYLYRTPSLAGSGTITSQYGLYFQNVTGAATNYSLFTNLGDVRLGDDVIMNAADGDKLWQGAGKDASMRYDGTNWLFNPKEVGSGWLHILGALALEELSADPSDPAEGNAVIWMSDGTGSGDDGDVLCKVTAGGSTKTGTLQDFSSI